MENANQDTVNLKHGCLRPRILIEVTDTISCGFLTGIQRVVHRVLAEADNLQDEIGVDCVPIKINHGRFYEIDGNDTPTIISGIRRLLRVFEKGANKRLSPRTLKNRLLRIVYCNTPMPWLVRKLDTYVERPIEFRESDIILLLDSSWQVQIWPAIERAKAQGCKIGCVSYDLIPLLMPSVVVEELQIDFRNWFDSLARHVDFFIAISETVRAQLQSYVLEHYPDLDFDEQRFQSFRLGSDFTSTTTGTVRAELTEIFADPSTPPFLAVGTICPHKNYNFLLDAFDEVRKHQPHERLVIIGKVGWMCDDTMDRIRRHPALNRQLFLLHDVNDTELELCYTRSKALIAPSLIEGFGLPIVEALQHDLPVLASDTPIHREVGQESCHFFDLNEVQTLVELMVALEQDLPLPKRSFQMYAWRDSTRELLEKTMRLADNCVSDAAAYRNAA